MNQTTNYQLNQWEQADRIMMSDFNADNVRLDAALAAIAANSVKCATGTYTGTNTSGSSNPCSLTFDFVPKLLVIFGSFDTLGIRGCIIIPGLGGIGVGGTSANNGTQVYGVMSTLNGTTVSWYANQTGSQANSAHTFHYVALG